MNGSPRWGFWLFIVLLVVLHFVLRIGLGSSSSPRTCWWWRCCWPRARSRAGCAAGLGLLLGILDGAVAPFVLGASALALTVLGYLRRRSREIFAGDNFVFFALYLFVGKWLYDTLLFLFTRRPRRPRRLATCCSSRRSARSTPRRRAWWRCSSTGRSPEGAGAA